MKLKFLLSFLLLLSLGHRTSFAQVCDCLTTGNCPVPIFDNGTFQGTLDVTVSGPNDLGQCPLTSVCFSITHTWVGDLAVTLTSPNGTNYIVMGDANNGTGGCGTDADNLDVCIFPGTGNALTNNTEYNCNPGPCSSGTCCLTGSWTMPCGGVSDPITGAAQAPGCDLNDFNIPGSPANGTWTLTVNDICASDVGTLNNFALTFACGVSACTVCSANGGALNQPDVEGCFGDPSLNLNISPQYAGSPQPNPGEYSYAWVLSQNGIITAVNPNPDMSNQPPGIYQLCGLSYLNSAGPLTQTLLGMNLQTAQVQMASPTAPFCGDFSDDCVNVTIGPPIPPTILDTMVCLGDCIQVGNQQLCGSGQVTLQSYLGCDSVIQVIMIPIPPIFNEQTMTVCQGECVEINNQLYCPPAPVVYTLPNWQGCDSTVTVTFTEIITSAVIIQTPPLPLSCTNTTIVLDGTASVPATVTYEWSGPTGFIGNQPVITVSDPGIYTLTVTNNTGFQACTSSQSVTITGDLNGPDLSLNSQQPTICAGQSFDLTTLAIADLNNTNPIISYHSGTPATLANTLPNTTVSPTATTTYYILATSGNCTDELPVTVTVNPLPVANFTVNSPICVDGSSTVTFTGTAGPNATYNWNFGGGTAVPGTGPGPHTVSWATGGTKTITLLLQNNGCQSQTVSQMVEVNTQIPTPVINCSPMTTSITFTWGSVPGANGYNVTVNIGPTGTMVNDTTYVVDGLAPGQQSSIVVEAISANECDNTSATLTCTAQDCPPVTVSIDPVPPICLTAGVGTVQLVASQTGGSGGAFSWSGPGVNPITGVFNPANANLGANTIVASYEEGTCLYNASRVITVLPQPTPTFTLTTPICATGASTANYTGNASSAASFAWDFGGGTATPGTGPGPHSVTWPTDGTYTVSLQVEEAGCSSSVESHDVTVEAALPAVQVACNTTTESIEFTWPSLGGAVDFTYTISPSNLLPSSTTDTSLLFTGLVPGDLVSIELTALDPGPCPDVTSVLTCTAQDCPDVDIQIDPVADICRTASTATIDLSATVTGGSADGVLSWSGGAVVDNLAGIFDPQLASAGANTVTAIFTDGNCVYSKDLIINVFNTPQASFTAVSPVCEGEDAVVTYTGTVLPGLVFDWDFGSGTASPGTGQGPHNVEWANAGTQPIAVMVTSVQGCASTAFSGTVEVAEPLVAPDIDCNTTTTSIEFTWPDVAGATTYEAIVVTGPSGSQTSQNNYTINNLTPGVLATLSLTVSNGGPCPPVTVQQTCEAQDCPIINLDITPVAPVCIGAATNVQLEAVANGSAGTGTGTWSGPGVVDPIGVFDPSVAGVGQHVLTFSFVEINCDYEATTTVVVFSEPSASFTATPVICVSDAASVTYTGNAAASATYTWDFGGGTATPGTGAGPHQVTWPAPGNYTISLGVNQNGCAATDVTNEVQVDATLTAPDIDCSTSTSTVEFSWDNVPGGTDYEVTVLAGQSGTQNSPNSYLVNGLVPGNQVTIQLTVSGNTACPPVTAQETCTAQDCPDVTVDIAPVSPICLTAASEIVDLDVTVNGGSGTAGLWSGNGITNAASGIFDPAAAGLGNHTVTFVYQENNCTYDGTLQVSILPPPVADAGADAKITCKDNQTTASLGGNGSSAGPNIAYTWSAATGGFPADSTILHPVVSTPGTYTLTVTNTALGCSDADEVVVEASQDIPIPELSIRPVSCYGENDGSISVLSVTGGEGPYLFSLNGSPFAANQTFQPLAPGVYELTVVDAAGCENSFTIDIQQPQELNVELVALIEGGGNIIRLGDSAQLEALITIPADSLDLISWQPDSLVSCDTCLDPFISPEQQTTFSITVESNGCSDSDEITVFVKKDRAVYVPNAFSPNEDGLNDLFMVFAGQQVAKVKSFLVFNRWGETVYQYFNFPPNDPAYGWDGMHRGEPLNPAVFTWFAEIEFIDGKILIFEGDVTLVR